MKKIIDLMKKDKIFFISIVLTIPSIFIWLFGGISYLWSFVSTYILLKLPSLGVLILLLIFPFVAFNLGLISYLKNKNGISKKIFLLNIFFVLLSIVSSIIFS
jgi:hypothetical protein